MISVEVHRAQALRYWRWLPYARGIAGGVVVAWLAIALVVGWRR